MHVQDQCKSQIKHMMNNGPICKFTWETHFHCQVLIFPSLPVLQFILQCTVSYTAQVYTVHGVVKLISHWHLTVPKMKEESKLFHLNGEPVVWWSGKRGMEQLKSSLTVRSLKSTHHSQLGVLIEKYSLLCSPPRWALKRSHWRRLCVQGFINSNGSKHLSSHVQNMI